LSFLSTTANRAAPSLFVAQQTVSHAFEPRTRGPKPARHRPERLKNEMDLRFIVTAPYRVNLDTGPARASTPRRLQVEKSWKFCLAHLTMRLYSVEIWRRKSP